MFKKRMCSALLAVVCCLPALGNAAICRSAQAAQAGSEAGYKKAQTADDLWAELERKLAKDFYDCLSRIRTTQIIGAPFPDLDELLDQVIEKVCSTVVNTANSKIPSSVDPWKELTK